MKQAFISFVAGATLAIIVQRWLDRRGLWAIRAGGSVEGSI